MTHNPKIAFIGLGHMGLPMALNLIKAGYDVLGFDLGEAQKEAFIQKQGRVADDIFATIKDRDVIITMLPAGPHVREVYTQILPHLQPGILCMDCSTIDVETSRDVHAQAHAARVEMVDAPVSGGVAGAESAKLTFMVGGSDAAFARANQFLTKMGKAVIHTGGGGNGQIAKICNNMILGISMIAVSEAFCLGEKLGLAAEKLFEVTSQSSGQCWSLTSYNPVPGLVEGAPANKNYAPGFAASMMLKDLDLAQKASDFANMSTPLGHLAKNIYKDFCEKGGQGTDFSGIITMIKKL